MKTLIVAAAAALVSANAALASTGHADDISRFATDKTTGAEVVVSLGEFIPSDDRRTLGDVAQVKKTVFDAMAQLPKSGADYR